LHSSGGSRSRVGKQKTQGDQPKASPYKEIETAGNDEENTGIDSKDSHDKNMSM